jgi:DMSO/TMAO reductase YedYZ molybdopterin-dependent catalytic subunit
MRGWYRPRLIALLLAAMLVTLGIVVNGSRRSVAAAQTHAGVSQATPVPTATPVIPESGGYSTSLTVGGSVRTPGTYTLADLQALPGQMLTTMFATDSGTEQHTYQGVRLYDLLQAAAPTFASQENGDKIGWYIQVTAIDGYDAVIAWGELDPENEAKPILVAYSVDGQPLGPGYGMAELVMPGDHTNSRYVTSIRSITVAPLNP